MKYFLQDFLDNWFNMSKLTAGVFSLLGILLMVLLCLISVLFGWQTWLASFSPLVRAAIVIGVALFVGGFIFAILIVPGMISRNHDRLPGYYYRPSLWRRVYLFFKGIKTFLRIK